MDEATAYFENMEFEFNKFEEERSKKIKVVYKKTLTEMSRIAYQQEAINVKIIAAEILGLNQSIVANLRNVLKLKDQDSFPWIQFWAKWPIIFVRLFWKR